MVHKHGVRDTGAHFTINQFTRQIKNDSAEKTTIVQYDHNSERLTFELPLYVDGHAMTLCDLIEIHFINISTDGNSQTPGVYEVTDIKAEGEKAIFTWLISQEATQLSGSLNFFIVFKCTENGVTVYRWGTEIYKNLAISDAMNNGEAVITEYPDILAQWKAQLFDASNTAVTNVATAEAKALAAIEAAGEAKKQSVLDSIPDEYEELHALADQNHKNKAGAIVLDAEGESIVLNDASEYPLQNLKVFGKSTQDGTPTQDAPVDIVSVENPVVTVAGKNLLDADLMINEQFKKNADGTYTITKNGASNLRFSKRAVCRIPKGIYILSVGSVAGMDDTVRIALSFASGKEMSCAVTPDIPKVLVADEDIVKFATYIPSDRNDGEYTTFAGLMMEYGSVVTEYEPYSGMQTVETANTLPGIPVSSGGNYTDENGQQWICDEVDLARGVYVQRIRQVIFDGSDDEKWSVLTVGTQKNPVFVVTASGMKFATYPIATMCDSYIHAMDKPINDLEYWANDTYFGQKCVAFRNDAFVDVDSWKDYLSTNQIELLYELATPIETPLSEAEINAFKALHTNKPNTTILNDAGAYMAVEYVADTKTYIDNKIKEMIEEVTG